ncbi:MAG: ribosome small subunit-dependent GTPase A [Thermoplasmatota archaeon]
MVRHIGGPELNLHDLGWNNHFQSQLEELSIDAIAPGRVFKIDGPIYRLYTEAGEISARVPGRMFRDAETGSELPGIGDWVLFKELDSANMIFKVLHRSSKVSRKVPGKEAREQLIAANIDIIFIVMGLDDDFNLRRMERYIAMVKVSGAVPVVILNKSDLNPLSEEIISNVRDEQNDVPVHLISALKGSGLDVISGYLGKGVTIALVGSSGAGKSTLINAILGEERLKTGSVREKDGKGRHVTTARELIVVPGGGLVVDNPGMREIQLWGDESSVSEAFPDIEELSASCRFKDCRHISEPGCSVKEAVDSGEISRERYDNYLKMMREIAHLRIRKDKSAEAAERARWRGIMKDVKYIQKYKKERY